VVAVGDGGDVATLDGHRRRWWWQRKNKSLFVDDTQIERWQTPMLDLGIVSNNGFCSRHSRNLNSVQNSAGIVL
jgi:hypothetical protein